MMSSDEPDYMSDVFVTEAPSVKSKPRNVPPKRLQRKRETKSSRNALEQQVREEGLAKPLSADNKGYSLLYKMGYVHGESLGKSGINGRMNPIPVAVKEGRLGLGRDVFVKETQEKKVVLKEQQLTEFRTHCLSQSAQRKLKNDLRKSRQTCEHLDVLNNHSEPIANWYWLSTYNNGEEPEEGEGEGEETSPDVGEEEEQLSLLTEYLRKEYYYCLWCGSEYSNEEELLTECPGNSWTDHQL